MLLSLLLQLLQQHHIGKQRCWLGAKAKQRLEEFILVGINSRLQRCLERLTV